MTLKTYSIQSTFLFYDYETFGTSPSLDRPVQFAAVRSDTDFNIIEEPKVFYCKPANDYLPQPKAVMLTGITPQEAHEKGVNEASFARRIHELLTVPNTCAVGYNNIHFDDEMTRNIFYRNFYDPYAWSWKNGNSRWDLLGIMRACYALRPEGIVWPKNKDGLPSFRLENLTLANGISHREVHDAMADVYATLAIAKLVKTAQPRLFDYLLRHRHKNNLMTLIDVQRMKPLVYVCSIFGARRGNTSWVAPLTWHPINRNALIVVDLASDITPLLELDSEALIERLYTSQEALRDDMMVAVKLLLQVHINKCPVLAQASALRPKDANRLGIDYERCLKNLKLLRNNPDVRTKAAAIFLGAKPSVPFDNNVDTQLYNGFFSPKDRANISMALKTDPSNLTGLNISCFDSRIKRLMFNYRARNYPETLNETEQARWLHHRKMIFTPNFLQSYFQELETLSVQYKKNDEKQKHLKALWQYAQKII